MTDQNLELLIILLIGIFLFVWGYYKHTLYKNLISSGIKTEGTIVDIKVDIDDGAGTYFPVISYNSINNGDIIKRYDIGTNPTPFRIGDSVSIIFYDQEDNNTFVIESNSSKILGPILIIVGLVVVIICLIQYFFHLIPIS